MNHQKELEKEFNAEEGSFLLKLRTDLFWDHENLITVLTLMKACSLEMEDNDSIPRELAGNFWYFSKFVESWSSHPNFPKVYSEKYYEAAYELIFWVCSWFFNGRSPWEIQDGFEREVKKLEKLARSKTDRSREYEKDDDDPF